MCKLYTYVYLAIRKTIFFLRLEKPFSVASKRFLDAYYNENGGDIRTDGEADFLARNKSTLGVVFDVGANIGEWTRFVLSTNPKAEVHCFEPTDFAFPTLTTANLPTNVHLNKVALGSKVEKGTLHIFDMGHTNLSNEREHERWNASLYGRSLI